MDQWRALGQHVSAFRRAHTLIAAAKTFTGHKYEIDFIGLRIDGAADPLFIERKRNVPGWS